MALCERMRIRSHSSQTLISPRDTLGIRRERSKYADIGEYRLWYTQRPYLFEHVQILSANASV